MTPSTQYLDRPGGRLAYDDRGSGALVVCAPGMGDLRAEYRFLAPALVEAGFRVVTADLRGHGDSDATFTDFERTTVGDDLLALVRHLHAGPAHLIGNSMAASAAVWAAAEAPELVASLTLIGPFVRDGQTSTLQEVAFRALLADPWGPRAWTWWYGKLYPGQQPADLDEYRRALLANLREPGRFAALKAFARTSCRDIESRLDEVEAPTLVVMGTADPDWPDPAAEARWIAERLNGGILLVDGAGHYPHAEQPETTAVAIRGHLEQATAPAV